MPEAAKTDNAAREAKDATLQGLVATADDEKALLDALEQAFDYRGDITITLADGSTVFGYLFDRRRGDTLAGSSIRIMTPEPHPEGVGTGGDKVRITYDRIATLEFTGKDTAHGKGFERWVERFVQKKLAEIESAGE